MKKSIVVLLCCCFSGCAEIGTAVDDVVVGTICLVAAPFYRPEPMLTIVDKGGRRYVYDGKKLIRSFPLTESDL